MPETGFKPIDYVVLVLYFAAMAGMGPLFYYSSKTTEGYLLGDRNFKGWLVGFSMFATSISSVTFVAYPADAYKTAWYRMSPNWVMPIAIIIATTTFLPFFRKSRVTSAYEYLEGRFGPWTRVYAASAFIVMQVVRVSLILFLVSVLVNEIIPQIQPWQCIIIGGIITTFYSVLGGIKAVLWTDFIQALVLWVGGLIALIVIVANVPGGIGEIVSTASEAGKFAMADLNADSTALEPVPWLPDFSKGLTMLSDKTVLLFMLVGLGRWLAEYSSNQNVIQRAVASKSPKEAKIAMWTCCLFSVPTWAMFMFLGTALWVYFKVHPNPEAAAILTGEGGAKAERILPFFVIHYLPPGLTGLVIAAVLAAAMSSLSSSINSVSAVSLVDIYKRHIRPNETDDHYVKFAKWVGAALGVIMIVGAMLLWILQSKTLQDTANVLTALTSGGLLGLYLLGFFTRIGDDRAMLVAIGFTLVFTLWMSLSTLGWIPAQLKAPIFPYYTDLLGHIIFFAVGYLVGLALPRKERDLTNLTVWTLDDKPLV